VPNPGSLKSIMEAEGDDPYEERFGKGEKRMEECERRIGECEAFNKRYTGESRVGESTGGARTEPPPAPKPAVKSVDPFKFARGEA
jgi:hypothetical protein